MNTFSRIASFFASLGGAGNRNRIPELQNEDEWVLRDEIERQLIERELRRNIY